MKDMKNIIAAIILAAAIIIAAVIIGEAIKHAGWLIVQGLDHISTSVSNAGR